MSDLALRLIAENQRTQAKFLDLGNCGLNKIPSEIGQLVWLKSLSLAAEWLEWDGEKWQPKESQNKAGTNETLTDLSPLQGLTSLQSVYVFNTRVSDLGPLQGLTSLQSLHVSNTDVSDLSPLHGLTSLQSLNVARTRVSNVGPLQGLTSLRVLLISEADVSDLGPLQGLTSLQTLDVSHTQVSDLGALQGLTSLQTLDVSHTQVSDLGALQGLTSLRTLDVSHTLVSDLEPLQGFSALRRLVINNTPVCDLKPLAGLSTLEQLVAWSTQVVDLEPLAGLSAMQYLYLYDTKVSQLDPLAGMSALRLLVLAKTQTSNLHPLIDQIRRGLEVRWELVGSHGIFVEKCPLTNPPPEIVKQGNEAILNYFLEREAGGVDHLYEAKMLILGEGGAGKTSLLRRLYQPDVPLPSEAETTKGIAIYRHQFPLRDGRIFRLNVWDFAGQEIYKATHQFFLTRRSLYVLVDDTRKDYKSVSDEGFRYWLELIDVFGGHSPTLIFQNEKGGRSKAIDFEGIKRHYDNVERKYAGNLETSHAADRLREDIEFFASHLSHIGEELPARWIKVREDIEKRAREEPYVPVQEYFEIYKRHMDFDRTKALHLSRYLHDLGVFLHFQDDPLLAKTVILQNQWATEAVFRVLDDETVKSKFGRFEGGDCARLWEDSAYADMHLELLALMQRFELCYELRDSKPPSWLVPQLLPPAKPAALAEWGKAEDLVLRYRYDFLPRGTISRMTVRQHRFVQDAKMAWVTGVVFERDSTRVLVEVLPGGNEIELRARGPEQKALLSVIAADLDALNDSFQGLRERVEKRIPCICNVCRAATVPEFFDQKELVRRKEHNKLRVECRRSFEAVDVLEMLDGVRTDKLPAWAKEGTAAEKQRELRIFLASSSELREDRDAFDLYFRQQNDQLRKEGVYLEIIRWENFLDAMSETRLQNEYNDAIRDCDVFVSLFFTKTGKFTDEEFEVAHERFIETTRPLIYTYFKNADVKSGSARKDDFNSLWAFQEKLGKLGHYHTNYNNIEDLKLQFRGQIDKILEKLKG
jgi:Leucine-rich repeat (LRR) protein